MNPTRYREFARDCERLASRAKSEEERQILSVMAKTWRQLADEIERRSSKSEPPDRKPDGETSEDTRGD
jgi:hypothetical protein